MKKEYNAQAHEAALTQAQDRNNGVQPEPSLADRVAILEAQVRYLRIEVARLKQNPNA